MTPAEPVRAIAADLSNEMPISSTVNAVLHAGADVDRSNSSLLARRSRNIDGGGRPAFRSCQPKKTVFAVKK